jgi:hypothetical protein
MTLAEAFQPPNLQSERAHALDRDLPFPRHHDLGQGATEIVTAWGRGLLLLGLTLCLFRRLLLGCFLSRCHVLSFALRRLIPLGAIAVWFHSRAAHHLQSSAARTLSRFAHHAQGLLRSHRRFACIVFESRRGAIESPATATPP